MTSIPNPPYPIHRTCRENGCFVAETAAIRDAYREGGPFYSEPRSVPEPDRSPMAVVWALVALGVLLVIVVVFILKAR